MKNKYDSINNFRNQPTDYILTVHVQNLIATYGEEAVKSFVKQFIITKKRKNKRKAA